MRGIVAQIIVDVLIPCRNKVQLMNKTPGRTPYSS